MGVWDALAHFPDDLRADRWRWKLPYYMALSGEAEEATHLYIDLISQALNEQGVTVAELPGWFQSGELTPTYLTQSFELEVNPITLVDKSAAYLVAGGSLGEIDTPGSVCLLAVQDQNGFVVYQLHDGFDSFGFFPTLRNPSDCSARDVTGDGNAEIVVNHYSGGHVGLTEITVLGITQLPPKLMPFYPQQDNRLALWDGWINDYPVVAGREQLEAGVALGFCEEYGLSRYQWNSQWFEITSGQVVFSEGFAGGDDALPDCPGLIGKYVRDLKAREAAEAFQAAYAAYAPTLKSQREALDELRVRQGLYSAYAGDFETARAVFNEIVQAPAVSNSAWIQPAQDFLLAFEAPADLLAACLKVTAACEYDVALSATVATALAETPLAQLTGALRTAGVQITAEGWFDFDADGNDERWFDAMLPDAMEPELWIAATYGGVTKALLVGPRPVPDSTFAYLNVDQPEILTDLGNGQTLEVVRHPLTGEPFAVVRNIEAPEPAVETLGRFRELRERLIQGDAPASIYAQLLEIDQAAPTCPFEVAQSTDTSVIYYDCAAYRYTLALAAELAGQEREALAFYQAVLNDYPDSTFAELARARLDL